MATGSRRIAAERLLAPLALAAALAAVAGAPASATAAGWPFYGHDYANSRDGGMAGPPASAIPSLSQAWSFHSPDGDFTGTPVVAGGAVVAGSSGGTVFALDRQTGQPLWSHDFNQPINGSAAIAGGRVFVPLATVGGPKLAALTLKDGSVLWVRSLSDQKDSDVFGSPVVWNGTAFIGTSSYFGETNDPNVRTRGSVVALSARTGRLRWRTYTVPRHRDGGAVWSTPAIDTATGALYVGTGNAYHKPAAPNTDSILRIDASSGRIVDHFQATAGDVWNATTGIANGPDADFGASPNLIEGPKGRPLVGEGQKSGTYWLLDRKTLKPVWNTTIGAGSPAGGILGSTAFDGHQIYGPDTVGGEVWALGLNGSPEWASADLAPRFNPVAVANGVVYSSDASGFLTERDASTGLVIGKQSLGAGALGGAAVADGTVFAVTGTTGGPGNTTGQGFVEAFRP